MIIEQLGMPKYMSAKVINRLNVTIGLLPVFHLHGLFRVFI